MDDYGSLAAKGLKLLFVAEIFSLLSSFIPFLNVACLFVGFVLSLTGLNSAAQAHAGFQRAMSLLVVTIAVNLGSLFVPRGGLAELVLTLVSVLLPLTVLYTICTTTAALVEARGNYELALLGRFTWKLNLVCTLISLGGVVLFAVLSVAALIFTVIFAGAAIANLVGGVLYLMFLYQASAYLRP